MFGGEKKTVEYLGYTHHVNHVHICTFADNSARSDPTRTRSPTSGARPVSHSSAKALASFFPGKKNQRDVFGNPQICQRVGESECSLLGVPH